MALPDQGLVSRAYNVPSYGSFPPMGIGWYHCVHARRTEVRTGYLEKWPCWTSFRRRRKIGFGPVRKLPSYAISYLGPDHKYAPMAYWSRRSQKVVKGAHGSQKSIATEKGISLHNMTGSVWKTPS